MAGNRNPEIKYTKVMHWKNLCVNTDEDDWLDYCQSNNSMSIFDQFDADQPSSYCFQLFINNEFVASKSGKTFPTLNPCTGEKIVDVAEADKVKDASIMAAQVIMD